MDKTETYIKMSDCPDIQDALRRMMGVDKSWGEWCSVHNRPYFDHNDRYNEQLEGKCKPIIRPSQDQLQEMMGDGNNPYPIIKRFADYALSSSRLDGGEWIMTSMEQLWLAFVMKEKYNKVWDDKWSML